MLYVRILFYSWLDLALIGILVMCADLLCVCSCIPSLEAQSTMSGQKESAEYSLMQLIWMCAQWRTSLD